MAKPFIPLPGSRSVADILNDDNPKPQYIEKIPTVSKLLVRKDSVSSKAPTPPREGRKYKGNRTTISLTADDNLLSLFAAKQKELGISRSELFDTILWNFFGKPKLSFEE